MKKCQFLIGKVQLVKGYYVAYGYMGYMCQFLIGKVQLKYAIIPAFQSRVNSL